MDIIIQGAGFLHNEGAVAMLFSTINLLEQTFKSPRLYVPVSKSDLQPTQRIIKKYRLNVSPFLAYGYGYKRLLFGLFLNKLSTSLVKRLLDHRDSHVLQKADLVVDISGDTLSDHYGKKNSFEELLHFLPSICYKRKIVILPQSIGPYIYQRNRIFAKYIFNRCKLVIPREPITNIILKGLGIKTISNVIINDVGFWLKPANKDRLKEIIGSEKINTHLPIVGISVSQSFVRFRSDSNCNVEKNYFNSMLDAIDFCVNKLNANILLIPHVTGPDTERHDDRIACRNLYKLSEHKAHISLLKGHYKADELKGLISQCRIFIGARMHANIAALSSCVPTLAISYSHKTEGIMKLLGLERWVYSGFAAPIDNILSELVKRREEIQRSLEAKRTEFEHNRHELIRLLRAVENE